MKYYDLKTIFSLLKLSGRPILLKNIKYCPSPCPMCLHSFKHIEFFIEYDELWATNKCMRCGVEDKNPIESIFLKIKGRFFKKYLSLNLL